MGIAADINYALTGATLRQGAPEQVLQVTNVTDKDITYGYAGKPKAVPLRRAGFPAGPSAPQGRARLALNRETWPAEQDTQKAVILEHQHGQYRAFHIVSQELLHSHVCKAEVVRRTERDGYHFVVLA